MKKKLVLVEYMGQCSSDGQLLGHSYKVQKEYYDMLNDSFEIGIVSPLNTKDDVFDRSKVVYFLEKNTMVREKSSFITKVKDFLLKLSNINKSVKNAPSDYYWFYNIDFSLIVYMFFHKKVLKKSMITLYRNNFGGTGIIRKMKKKILDTVVNGSLLNIYTGKNFTLPEANSFYMPDYYYVPEKYDKYQNTTKEDLVVCLGTMNRFKLLDPTVDAFSKMQYKLYLGGKFHDETWKNDLINKATDNITIEDKYLDSEEYLDIFSKARYCIIPYDRGMYNMRTSGVLQECVFMKTIPLTFDWFLEQNESMGLSFNDISEVSDDMLKSFDAQGYDKWCEEQINTRYNKKAICDGLINSIKTRGV